MRQSMEEEPMAQSGYYDNDVGLARVLAEVVEEVRQSIDRDINGADLLYSLLSAPWLYSLLRVYECLVQYSRDAPNPCLPYSSRLSQEKALDERYRGSLKMMMQAIMCLLSPYMRITASLRGLPTPSSEAQELYILLKSPHMQAFLSAHDSVAQRDYGPVLPPLPDNLPDNEEAVRIVCLVKNKQPLCVGEGKPSNWNSLRRLTMEKLAFARQFGSEEQSPLQSADALSSIPFIQPHSLPSYQSTRSCNLCCQTARLSVEGLNLSAPAVYDSVIVENCANGVEAQDEGQHNTSLVYPRSCCTPQSSGVHSQTAPSSPMLQRHHSIDVTHSSHPALRFKKQHSLDELRSTVHTVANSMDARTRVARDLKQKMVAVTEKMTDNVVENAQALSLLVEVVDKLQGLIIANKSPEVSRAVRLQHDGAPNWPGQPIMPTCSHTHCVSSFSTSSASSSASLFSSSSESCNIDSPYVAPNQTRNKQSKTKQTSSSNDLTASSPNDDCDTILCLSSKKKKSKMRK